MFNILDLKKAIVQEFEKEQAKGTKLGKFVVGICEDIKTELEGLNPIFLLYINDKKKEVGLKHNGKTYISKCHEKDKFDKYVGASIVLGYDYYGSKSQYNKALGVGRNMFETASLVNAYTRFGGKKAFETYVDDLIATCTTENKVNLNFATYNSKDFVKDYLADKKELEEAE